MWAGYKGNPCVEGEGGLLLPEFSICASVGLFLELGLAPPGWCEEAEMLLVSDEVDRISPE